MQWVLLMALFLFAVIGLARWRVQLCEGPRTPQETVARLQLLRDRLTNSKVFLKAAPEAGVVLLNWTFSPSESSYCDEEARIIGIRTLRVDGSFWDSETLIRVLLHEIAHALRGSMHTQEFFDEERKLCEAAESAFLLKPGGSVDCTYPVQLIFE